MRFLLRVLYAAILPAILTPWASGPARADSVGIPIRATIIQCGARDEIRLSCQRDDRCCVFMDRVAYTDEEGGDAPPSTEMVRAELTPRYQEIKSASAPSARP